MVRGLTPGYTICSISPAGRRFSPVMAVRPRYTATPAKFLLYIRCTPSHITIPPPHIMKSPGTPTQRRRRRAWTIPPPPQEAHTAPRRAPQEAPSAAYALRRTQARSAHRSHSRPQEPPAVHPIPIDSRSAGDAAHRRPGGHSAARMQEQEQEQEQEPPPGCSGRRRPAAHRPAGAGGAGGAGETGRQRHAVTVRPFTIS